MNGGSTCIPVNFSTPPEHGRMNSSTVSVRARSAIGSALVPPVLFVPTKSLPPNCNRRGANYIEGIYPQST